MTTGYAQSAQPSPAMTDEDAEVVFLRCLPEPADSTPPDWVDRMGTVCEQDGYRAAVAQAQAARERLADASRWLIARVVNGSGLVVRTLENEAVITRPGRRGNGPVRILYAGGSVHHNGACLGILEGYEPSAGRRIGREEILAALCGNTP